MAQCGQLARVVDYVGGIETALGLHCIGISQFREAHWGELTGLPVSIGLQLSCLVVDTLHLTVSRLVLLLNDGSFDKNRLLLLLPHGKVIRRRYVLTHETALPALHIV